MMNSDDLYQPDQGYNIENSLAACTQFVYPAEQSTETTFQADVAEAVNKLASQLFIQPKPKLYLAALLYASGTDVGVIFGCENTLTAVAKALGVSKQTFSAMIKNLQEDFNLKGNTGKAPVTKEAYQQSNVRKHSNEET